MNDKLSSEREGTCLWAICINIASASAAAVRRSPSRSHTLAALRATAARWRCNQLCQNASAESQKSSLSSEEKGRKGPKVREKDSSKSNFKHTKAHTHTHIHTHRFQGTPAQHQRRCKLRLKTKRNETKGGKKENKAKKKKRRLSTWQARRWLAPLLLSPSMKGRQDV